MFPIFLNKRGLEDRKYVHFLSPKTIFVTQCTKWVVRFL